MMVDYSEMSDAEINKLVALAEGAYEVADGLFVDDVRRYQFHPPKNKGEQKFFFDPCNNPADAWPIILKHRISITFDETNEGEEAAEWATASVGGDEYFSDYLKCSQALRAAMIVFLMMQGDENG